jgi:hypothetical protein
MKLAKILALIVFSSVALSAQARTGESAQAECGKMAGGTLTVNVNKRTQDHLRVVAGNSSATSTPRTLKPKGVTTAN